MKDVLFEKLCDSAVNEWHGWKWNKKTKRYEGYAIIQRDQIASRGEPWYKIVAGRLYCAFMILYGRSVCFDNYDDPYWKPVRESGGVIDERRVYYRKD